MKHLTYLFLAGLIFVLVACNSTEVTELETSNDQSAAEIQTDAPTDSISFVAGQDMQSKRDRFGLLALTNGKLIAAGGREVGCPND